jgi:transcription-repair coupling factor (superfamily II helicase)
MVLRKVSFFGGDIMFENLFDSFDYKEVSGLTDELKSIYIYNYYLKENKPILIVTDTVYNANKMYQILQNYTDQVSLFPMDDFLPMMSLASSPEFKTTRLETINSLIQNDKQIVITNLTGYLKYITSKDDYNDNTILIKKGEDISVDELINKIESMGYVIDTIVNKTGEIAIRGYVIDVFPIGTEILIELNYGEILLNQ